MQHLQARHRCSSTCYPGAEETFSVDNNAFLTFVAGSDRTIFHQPFGLLRFLGCVARSCGHRWCNVDRCTREIYLCSSFWRIQNCWISAASFWFARLWRRAYPTMFPETCLVSVSGISRARLGPRKFHTISEGVHSGQSFCVHSENSMHTHWASCNSM